MLFRPRIQQLYFPGISESNDFNCTLCGSFFRKKIFRSGLSSLGFRHTNAPLLRFP